MKNTLGSYVITDIGSTTTKAILIDKCDLTIEAIAHANTTVEAPRNDVGIGVYDSIRRLEELACISLLSSDATAQNISFQNDITYLSTSSAGGGLQILVIGLTLFDSASSAKRAAYGAGGIILDVFAIDDKRKTVDQMRAMRNLRPDMILLCGGTDGGALSSVLRMAEILRIAKPKPKFSTSVKIPTIYAGNQDAARFIKRMISSDFDLHILPNLRPTLQTENLKPTQDTIQELFMENVMERAPGYKRIKDTVHSAILPTPIGVMKAMEALPNPKEENLFAFDIGGATTDVFTRINGHYQRTVSANLGMSYSALNVLAESGIEQVMALLPPTCTENEVRNYIGNKTIYPTTEPVRIIEYRIEHAIAKCALRLALEQHKQMHYNTLKLNYLDAMKTDGRDKYEAKFEYIQNEEKYFFYPSDFGILIGAGGVFAHAKNSKQCIDILISGFSPTGITKICIDRHFITPHLGLLSITDKRIAQHLLENDCLEELAIHIKPLFPAKQKSELIQVTLSIENDRDSTIRVKPQSFIYLEAKKGRNIHLKALNNCLLRGNEKELTFTTDLPIVIDTRLDNKVFNRQVEDQLGTYMFEESMSDPSFRNQSIGVVNTFTRQIDLPYKGDILVNVGDRVSPDDIVAVNQFNPPRLYVINPFSSYKGLTSELVRRSFTVQIGDKIDFDQMLTNPIPSININRPFFSPIRGRVEHIDFDSGGVIVAEEIQDYSSKPVQVNIADKMQLSPKKVPKFLKKDVGSFVYQGDLLAQRLEASGSIPMFVRSPATGEIVSYDRTTAIMTIQYRVSPQNYYAHVCGTVKAVEENKSVAIEYSGTQVEGVIGWGFPIHGRYFFKQNPDIQTPKDCTIVALDYVPSLEEVQAMGAVGAHGIICPSINEKEIVKILNHEQGVINTGNEVLSVSLILMEGFGDLQLSRNQIRTLADNSGSLCYMDPHTRIRAGVVRASICFFRE